MLRGLLAAIALVVLVAGVPVLLVATVGNPIPDQHSLTTPLSDTALLGVVACVAWVFWAQLAMCVVVEAAAELRLATGRSADWLSRVPGTFGGQQAIARTLVQAVVAIGVTTATTATPASWLSHAAATRVETASVTPQKERLPAEAANPAAVQHQHRSPVEVTVARGDTLWSLAETHLGAGERWREIADLNNGRHMADGSTFDDSRTLQPGWTLQLAQDSASQPDERVVTVRRGDTLWEIADDAYGEGADWPRIYQANHNGIVDPHWIYPGQRLLVPGQQHPTPARAKAETPHTCPRGRHVHLPTEPKVTASKPTVADGGQSAGRPTGRVEPPVPLRQPHQTEAEPTRTGAGGVTSPSPSPLGRSGRNDASDDVGLHVDGATLTDALLGGGGVLAAGLLAVYLGRRRTQSRNRHSGKVPPPVAAHLRADDKALRAAGSSASRRTAFVDTALRELVAQAESSRFELPDVLAARLDDSRLDLHLRTPSAAAPPPWTATADGLTWNLPADHQPTATDRISPYPAMVTLGVDEDDATWLIDLEAAGVVQIIGPTTPGRDLATFMAAELALNPWCQAQTLEVVGVAGDVVPLNPGLLYIAADVDVEQLTKTARQVTGDLPAYGASVLASRVADPENTWPTTLCIASLQPHQLPDMRPHTAALLDEMDRAGGRTTVAFIAVTPDPLDHRATTLELTSNGALITPWSVVRPNRLTADEATVLGRLFDDADTTADVDIPSALDPDGEPTSVDRAGALSADLTAPRSGIGDPASVLPLPDQAYLESAATTVEDLAVLAPTVPAGANPAGVATDPTLNRDLADWANPDSPRPKLRVLGPVELRAVGEKTREVEDRPAYFAELAAYLACHREGVTPNQVAADFGIQNNTLHTRLGQLRKWLGKNPDTGQWHLPAAQRSRGQQVYRLSGLLSDADLFRRLRARGQTRGPAGVADYRQALDLVAGTPYDQQRARGYGWLTDTPDDHYLTAGIVDLAHLYATHALTEGQPTEALWAAQKAITAAPYEDKPRLDLAKAMQAMGEESEAQRLLRDEVLNRTDDDRAPLDPSARTIEVIDRTGKNRKA